MLLSVVLSLGERRDERYHVETKTTTHIAMKAVVMELRSRSFGVKLCKTRSSGKYGCFEVESMSDRLVRCLSFNFREEFL